MKRILEVCCADPTSVKAASRGGADRIELCQSLETGGLTPSPGLMRYAVWLIPGKVNVLIRPRSGDFLYSPDELDVIESDIRTAARQGAAGIVFGALTADGLLDVDVMKRMIDASEGVNFTLHRAFDMCREPEMVIEQAIALGIDTILTSGLASDVISGINNIRRFNDIANSRISILAGGGVTPENVASLIQQTGISQVHASCKTSVTSGMSYRRNGVSMSTPDSDEFSYPTTSEEIVSRLAKIIHTIP